MSNKYLIEYKPSFILKIKNFLKKLFRKQIREEENETYNQIETLKNIKQDNFLNGLKIDIDVSTQVKEKIKFLEEIDGNAEMLSKLSIDRLKKLEQYYNGIIEENDKIIKKLKASA
ncbi:MAG: hypothetical protein IJE68_02825 [Clostridia bacterium]|nr:hypothetical protein [Clostridia bacterium]